MEVVELHNILDDENKIISLKEYQEILYQLKNDTINYSIKEELESQEQTSKCHWYNGETNAFQIALDLSEHIEQRQNQKTIECLNELRQEVLIDNCEDYSVDLNYLVETIDNKIKELEEE